MRKRIHAKSPYATASPVIVYKGKPYLTPRDYAQKHQVTYPTVLNWVQKGLLQDALKLPPPPPFLAHVYLIPADAPPPQLKPGPKAGSEKASALPRLGFK